MENYMDAKVSFLTFLLGNSFRVWQGFGIAGEAGNELTSFIWWLTFLVHGGLVSVGLKLLCTGQYFQNAIRGFGLGVLFGVGLVISRSETSWCCFGWYLSALAFFHWSEYLCTAVTNPKSLSLDSYLLNHSREYHIAAVTSWLEFWIEWALGFKYCGWINALGVVLTVGGECLRKLAMITASSNFNHYVQHVKRRDHELVTHGIYSWMRHPSYAGWFLWSVGTQVILLNPLCLVAYTYVSWKFFKHRIEDEEFSLLTFFGEQYVKYQKSVPTGVPFIKGCLIEH